MAKTFQPIFYKKIPALKNENRFAAAHKVSIGEEGGEICIKVQVTHKGKIQPTLIPSFITKKSRVVNELESEYDTITKAINELKQQYLEIPKEWENKLKNIDLTSKEDELRLEKNLKSSNFYDELHNKILNGTDSKIIYEDRVFQLKKETEYVTIQISDMDNKLIKELKYSDEHKNKSGDFCLSEEEFNKILTEMKNSPSAKGFSRKFYV